MKHAAFLIALLLPASAFAQAAGPAAPATSHAHHAPGHAVLPKTTVPATPISPAYIQLATNVEIIPNLEDAVKNKSAIATHEGIFGPLLFAEETRAFFIELQPGMFLAEHPHDIGSIIYTVRGKWVLASEGKRHVMQPGALFRFGDKMPTGWEAPFNEPALLLVVKPKGENKDYDVFNRGIKAMQASVDKDRKNGAPFYYSELKPDDPAIAYARSVNPNFDAVLKIKP
ncbi:cupin domain-containing protein [Phenylobacterium sp. LH3H17]|uniref:cupin domain-containing protein n=1 Tax=Phenylobacterium sp. LH3H17 TaxID=2903901 RepID=UPI0020C9C74B|nr:cupin domain-containing protein [Phenylobacterium sp. LH3H17]UTP38228.1 cupin domain-containing protein [Phenylobacterium sp. LH3H17]